MKTNQTTAAQKPAAKKRPAQPPKKKTPPRRTGKYLPPLSKCATDYAISLADPFTGPLACVPTYPAVLTRKLRVYAKGTFSTGTTGFGFIVFDPSYGIANDQTFVLASDALYGGVTIIGAVGTTAYLSNSDYQAADLGSGPNQIVFRVVSGGLRIRYIGTELNRGGQVCGLTDPNHNSLLTRTFGSLSGEEQSRLFPVNREWITLLYRPFLVGDTEFANSLVGTTPLDPSFYMGYALQSPTAGPCVFEFEAYSTYEAQGRNVRGMTASHVDPTGYAAVHTATNLSPALAPTVAKTADRTKSFLNTVGSTLTSTVSGMAPLVTSKQQAAASSGPDFFQLLGDALQIGSFVASIIL